MVGARVPQVSAVARSAFVELEYIQKMRQLKYCSNFQLSNEFKCSKK